jgi:DnaJ-class molecular chaperone
MPAKQCYHCQGTGKEKDGTSCLWCKGRGFEVESNESQPLICPYCGGENYIPDHGDLPREEGDFDSDVECEECGKKFDVSVGICVEFTFETFKKEES